MLKNLYQLILENIPPIHKEGWPFIILFGVATLIIYCIPIINSLTLLGVILTIWCVYFFRDPERVTPDDEGVVVSAGDGVISQIAEAVPPKELGLDEKRTRISVFLSVFNVHVNRLPISGEITETHYHKGKFLSANLDKASDDNERQTIVIKGKGGKELVCVQIAGLVARRIVCYANEGDAAKAGDRYGIIRFGSRVDIYLPKGVKPLVKVGQTAIAGETIFANMATAKPSTSKEKK